jgi:hypothetical protein
MSLYDEIMALKNYKHCDCDYDEGFDDALEEAATLAKKYDEEIERIKREIEILLDCV